ncbi:MAG: ribonuclease III [Nitrospirae bacterium]|nr:ribonuclease III [Nitrospirota bacterium]
MPVLSSGNIQGIEDSLGYTFKHKSLLVTALTHKSYHHENVGAAQNHNERMEFLGDSVLGLIIAEALYLVKDSLSEAGMSKIKSYLVKEQVLFEMASRLSLGDYLSLGKGEESTGGRQKRSVLSNAFEALVGAVFLDSDYLTAKEIVLRVFNESIERAILKKEAYDFKSDLQEKVQSVLGTLPEYRIVRQEGEEHKKVFTTEVYVHGKLFGTGSGKSKKESQMAAAKEALEKLEHE